MFLRRLKHMLIRLSAEEKVIGVGSLAVIFGLFMPWYSVVLNFEKGVTESGFSGDMGVLGFVVFLFTLMALSFLVAEHLHVRLPHFGFQKESVLLFFSGESAFLLLLAVAIFTKRSLDYTNAELRFGLYTALIGAVVSAFSAFALIQKIQKKEAKAFFDHEEVFPEDKPYGKSHKAKDHEEVSEKEEAKFFDEEAEESGKEEVLQMQEETIEEPVASGMVEEEPLAEHTVSEPEEQGLDFGFVPKNEPKDNRAHDQGKYILRDAKLTVAEEPAKEPEQKPTASANTDFGFYNDL